MDKSETTVKNANVNSVNSTAVKPTKEINATVVSGGDKTVPNGNVSDIQNGNPIDAQNGNANATASGVSTTNTITTTTAATTSDSSRVVVPNKVPNATETALESVLNSNRDSNDFDLNLNIFFGIMRNESERLFTFNKGEWPVSFISKESLARAGFFYLMNLDRVQCPFCQGVICSWEPGDEPLEEHRRHFPRCTFIMGYSVGNVPIGEDPIRPKRRVGRDICGGGHAPASMPTAESLTRVYKLPEVRVSLETYGVRVHRGAKNTQYASRDWREMSFSDKWPKNVKYTPAALAEAGFYFTGLMDCVKCFYCDVGVCDWNCVKEPWTEHAIRSPECDYLILNKGTPFINCAKKAYEEELTKNGKLTEEALEERNVDEWINSEIVKKLLEIHQYSKEELKEVLRKRWRKDRRNFDNVGELNQEVQLHFASLCKETQNKESQKVENGKSSAMEIVKSEPLSSLCSSDDEGLGSSPPQSSPTSSGTPSPTFDKERLLCKTCLDNEVGVVFLPCAHLVACTQCAPGLRTCPVCRAIIKGTVRTFLA